MQTFLPYSSFGLSASVLDYKRLGKQRLEAKQLLQALHFPERSRWWNHPACKMWHGCEKALAVYWLAMCREWKKRGYQDNLIHEAEKYLASVEDVYLKYPWWLGEDHFHAAHRSNLLRKLPSHYSKFGWTEHPHMAYWWPDAKNVPNRLKRA